MNRRLFAVGKWDNGTNTTREQKHRQEEQEHDHQEEGNQGFRVQTADLLVNDHVELLVDSLFHNVLRC